MNVTLDEILKVWNDTKRRFICDEKLTVDKRGYTDRFSTKYTVLYFDRVPVCQGSQDECQMIIDRTCAEQVVEYLKGKG